MYGAVFSVSDMVRDTRVLAAPHNTTAMGGETVILECLADGNPPPAIEWLRPGRLKKYIKKCLDPLASDGRINFHLCAVSGLRQVVEKRPLASFRMVSGDGVGGMAAVETETVPSEWCGTGDGVGVWQQWKQKPSLQSGVK